ncbi:MAG: hypothetical protein ACLFV7_09100, partial [Phycisphaerae bacterium]
MAPFEVVAGMNRAQGEEKPKGEEARPEPKPQAVRQPVPAVPSARPRPQQGSWTGEESRPEDAYAAGSKLTLSVSHVALLVAAGGAIVLLAAAFLLGRMTAPAAAPQTPGDATAPTRRETGRYYLVVEATDSATIGDRKEAEHIAWFLEQQGVEASVL